MERLRTLLRAWERSSLTTGLLNFHGAEAARAWLRRELEAFPGKRRTDERLTLGMKPEESIPQLLEAWRRGDHTAYDRLFPLIYTELRRLARAHLRHEPQGHSLQPTLLVHEVYLRLGDATVDWRNRTHFLSIAARVMRRILVEHARAKAAAKRGGHDPRVTLTGAIPAPDASPVDVLVLDTALDRLRTLDARQSEVVELFYFGGLTHAEIGEVVGVSEATIDRDLRHARAWLRRELAD
jgi:RNA polymerase sigma factor (TIGR02999 family)